METRTVEQVKVYMVTSYDVKYHEDMIVYASFEEISEEKRALLEEANDDCNLSAFHLEFRWMEFHMAEELVSKFTDGNP